ncbi:MAG: NUDIX hydrolase [Thermomicrobiales bacterium]
MTMLRLAVVDMLFHVRVAVVCLHDGHVLLQGTDDDGRWILPGGHSELLEPTDATARREMREEFGVAVEVGRLLWVVENFFTTAGIRTHQIGFIYEARLPSDCGLLDTTRDFVGDDSGAPFIARWFPIASLPDTRLLPSFLCEALQSLPETPQHLVHLDVES